MSDPVRKIAHVKEILEEVRGSGEATVEQQLKSLFDKFNLAARAIDPSITGAWVGYDESSDFQRPTYIMFERSGASFFRGRA